MTVCTREKGERALWGSTVGQRHQMGRPPPSPRGKSTESRSEDGLGLGRSPVPPSRRAGRAAHGGQGDRWPGQWKKGEEDVMTGGDTGCCFFQTDRSSPTDSQSI